MASYRFGDEDNLEFIILEPGEYQFEVLSVETSIVGSGKKTSGSDQIGLRIAISRGGNLLSKWTENLILHASTAWKVDTFVKSSNLLIDGKPPVKGQNIDFGADTLTGLRGWCLVHTEEYTPKSGGEKKKTNRVQTWITNKEKLSRIEPEDKPF